MIKICCTCKEEKDLSDFQKRKGSKDGHTSACKKCRKVIEDRWKNNNPEKRREAANKWAINNRESQAENRKRHNSKPERIAYLKEYRKKHRERYQDLHNNRYKTDPLYNITCKYRRRVYMAIKRKYTSKANSTVKLLGVPFETFKKHIESLFTKGMTWEKVMSGDIHLDHKMPLSTATNEDELASLFHYSNVQPLWAKENLSKNDNIVQHQIKLAI